MAEVPKVKPSAGVHKANRSIRRASEHDIQSVIISVLKHLGIVCWRNNSQGTYDQRTGQFRQMTGHTRKGVSDIIGVLPGGRALFIEVKSARGKTSAEQDSFLADTANAGALSFVAKSLSDVLPRLTDIPGLDNKEIQRLIELTK